MSAPARLRTDAAMERRERWRFDGYRFVSAAATALAVAAATAFFCFFAIESWPAWRHAGAIALVSGTEWFYRAEVFGAAAMIYGTVVVTAIACVLAAPLGLAAAIWLSELVPSRTRMPLKALIELLAGIPSVVYGLLGVLLLRDWVGMWVAPWGALSGDTLFTGGVLLAVMILPTFVTLADDALSGVPQRPRLGARALALTRAEAFFHAVLPHARPGIVAAGLLALGRALGETIAVFLVIGRQDNQWPEQWLSPAAWIAPGQTLTTKLGGAETFIALGDPLHWGALLALAVLLTLATLGVTFAGSRLAGVGHAPRA